MAGEQERPNGQPTETSPLLPKATESNGVPAASLPNEPAGVVRAGDNATEEQQQSGDSSPAGDGQKQFEGLPEVKKQMKYLMPALGIGIFLAAADQTIIVSSYGKIGSELDALNLTSWIATSYWLTLTSFQPLYGKLSDIFGRKAALLFAYSVFGLGCLFCGFARDINQLIAARAFAGIGAGGMTTVVSILLSDVVSLRERGKWQGYLNLIFAAGSSSGLPLGGLFADSVGWRWSFIVQAPLCLVAFIAVSFALHLPTTDDADWKKKLARIDFLGAAVLISAVFTLLLALDRGSNVSWSATITIVSISVSVPLFMIFVLVERKVAKEPFAPGHIIFNRSMFACYACNFFSIGTFMAMLFYVPLFLQATEGLSATGASIRLIPVVLCSVTGSLGGGIYMQRSGKYYWLTVLAYSGVLIGAVGAFVFSGPLITSTLGVILSVCLSGLGNGISVTTTLISLIANASPQDQAVTTACSYLFRSLGSVFGISMSATVANQTLRKMLASELPSQGLSPKKAAEIADRVRQSLTYVKNLDPQVQAVVIDCYQRSTSAAFALQAGLVIGAVISSWFITEKTLSR
ncbi:hypothetical protein BAUCODRAFT_562953 [Baudoinia panamericana UAMH 10762]|uniref:Major facilitator superfamily (MFS) profile domain-containing protein n=1 Tax=Baudoinia panamericana (strain UAMH 10762) TaxID=717646 RepID=M2LKK4_BAUPA|nr:uncharacterized protein BAUCODRAFT_562953 [Baudoinia panamericana UAMH 10762]EMC94812.1 hypothetical protein BAUCODRAFT_562953 [Baudoinia panamericana UAMH 10762]